MNQAESTPRRRITQRQMEVLSEMAQGKNRNEIAKDLHISKGTVRTHVDHLKNVFVARSKEGVVFKAAEEGFLALDEDVKTLRSAIFVGKLRSREREVLEHFTQDQGTTTSQIAEEMHLKPHTDEHT
jgi:DNA-binding NarL/FixJ family response regulator